MMQLLHLPTELLLQITSYFTDPLDLIDLRLTHPLLFHLLAPRASKAFPDSAWILASSPNRTCAGANHVLFWVAAHNYPRLLRHILTGYPPCPHLTKSGIRQACINAARHGQIDSLTQLFDYFSMLYGGPTDSERFYLDCFDAAISAGQDNVAVALMEIGVRPSWENEDSEDVLGMVMEEHRLDVMDYIIRLMDGEHSNEYLTPLPDEDKEAINLALDTYLTPRQNGVAGDWCQRILYTHIRRWGTYEVQYFLTDARIEAIASAQRRGCGPECDIWFTESHGERRVRLGRDAMLDELRRLQMLHEEQMEE